MLFPNKTNLISRQLRLGPKLAAAFGMAVRPEVAILVGIGLRVWFFLLNDSFWRDETKLLWRVAQNIFVLELTPSMFGLYRFFYQAGWGGELPVRAPGLLASIAALPLFFLLARRVLIEQRAVAFVTWLLALAPGVILFAGLAKPYSLDILVAAGLLWLARKPLTEPQDGKGIFRLTLAAVLAPWISYPSVFVAGGIGVGLLLRRRSLGFRRAAGFLALVSLSTVLLMVTLSSLGWLSLSDRAQILTTLKVGPNTLAKKCSWLFCQVSYAYLGPQLSYVFTDARSHTFSFPLLGVAGLVLGGIWESRLRYNWGWTAALAVPLVLALAVSYFRMYFPYGRLLFFAVPGLFLLAGYGVIRLERVFKRPKLVGFFLILLIIPCAQTVIKSFWRPIAGVREALQYISAHQQPGDLVFFDTFTAPTVFYYRLLGRPYAVNLRYGLKPEEWEEVKVDMENLQNEDLLAMIPADQRVWLVAETVDYARGPVVQVLPYWKELGRSLAATRKMFWVYNSDRVQLQGFSAQ